MTQLPNYKGVVTLLLLHLPCAKFLLKVCTCVGKKIPFWCVPMKAETE